MRRSVAYATCLATCLASAGCSLGWRTGVGFAANTEGSVSAQIFAGAHLGGRMDSRDTVEIADEVAGSIRSKPARLGLGNDVVISFRREPNGKGLGWMAGYYLGVRGLFLHGNRTELREGGSFAFLPTLDAHDEVWKQVGIELQAGFSSITDEPDQANPVDNGEFALRFFYEVSSTKADFLR